MLIYIAEFTLCTWTGRPQQTILQEQFDQGRPCIFAYKIYIVMLSIKLKCIVTKKTVKYVSM